MYLMEFISDWNSEMCLSDTIHVTSVYVDMEERWGWFNQIQTLLDSVSLDITDSSW